MCRKVYICCINICKKMSQYNGKAYNKTTYTMEKQS